MKKRTSSMSQRIVSLLMSMVLTLTLVTPAAFATEVVGGSGTAIIEGNANPADANPSEDSENNEDKNTEDGKDEQPTEPDDEDKGPSEDDEIIADEEDADDGDIYAAGKTVSVEKDKTVTLYAVWENIWTGSGTEADAYQISNAADLTALQTQVNEKGFSNTASQLPKRSSINVPPSISQGLGVCRSSSARLPTYCAKCASGVSACFSANSASRASSAATVRLATLRSNQLL